MENARAAPFARCERVYTPYEVAVHNTPQDCWVSFLGGVYNLTELVKAHSGALIVPIIVNAGQDISHWFDHETGDLKMRISPVTHRPVPYTPQGRFVGVPPDEPSSQWDCCLLPWWRDAKQYRVGLLSRSVRPVRVCNVLTGQEDVMEVPQEETLGEIRRRYLALNAHAASYTWKALLPKRGAVGGRAIGAVGEPDGSSEAGAGSNDDGHSEHDGSTSVESAADSGPRCGDAHEGTLQFLELDMNKTLVENGVVDEREAFEELGLAPDWYMPVLHLHWIDDLTIA